MTPARRSHALGTPRHRAGTAVLAKGQRRTETILDAATAILIEKGYAHLSTRKIAARAGIRPGNLQYYYRSKQDIVRAVLDRYLQRAMAQVKARIEETDAAEERLQTTLTAILGDQQSAESCRFFWELWALAARDPEVAGAMSAFYEGYWRAMVLTLLNANPTLGRPRAERRAALLVSMLEGLTLFRSRQHPHELPLPGLERELRALVEHLASQGDRSP